ncbi:hypothetical protein QQP08_000057 [Theobroma cacao]|nr:hypothetical protein QQP08_000057 [Theobroma cacao]
MISVRVAERWRNRRITQPITSLTRPTRMGSRNPKGTGTHPPKEFMDPKFLRNQRYARKHNKKNGGSATEEE